MCHSSPAAQVRGAAECDGVRHDAQRTGRGQLARWLDRCRQAHEAGRIGRNRRGRHGVAFLARIVAPDQQVPVFRRARGVAQLIEGDAHLDHPAVCVDARGHLDFEIRRRGRSAGVLVGEPVPHHAIGIEIEQLRHAPGSHRIHGDGYPVLFVREVVAARESGAQPRDVGIEHAGRDIDVPRIARQPHLGAHRGGYTLARAVLDEFIDRGHLVPRGLEYAVDSKRRFSPRSAMRNGAAAVAWRRRQAP